ncbi:hypothetical protein Sjap_024373 [Stephania japonica]|uniref:Peptidase S54 rhomboid domain-containing protein n=1 Tax=Stephania japonica TaxID=461633 RepID=A0AAP0ED97_9MAGN
MSLAFKNTTTNMAVVPINSSIFTTDHVSPSKLIRRKEMHVAGKTRQRAEAYHRACKETCMPFPMKSEMHVKCSLQNEDRQAKTNCGEYLKRENISSVFSASGSKSNERQLRALDSYFHKLQNAIQLQGSSKPSKYYDTFPDSEKKKLEPSAMLPSKETKSGQFNAVKELSMLDTYLDKLNQEEKSNDPAKLAPQNDENNSEGSQVVQPNDETSDTYLVSVLAAINIAVFLFEIASPVKNSDIDLLTLPSLYGAKINQLILVGEWWRLVTPMFLNQNLAGCPWLHEPGDILLALTDLKIVLVVNILSLGLTVQRANHYGILHVALSCWVLLNFGPQVCKGYGSCTFLLLYILGGISGNLTSFIHTPDPTVGGTGPTFAIIGAWLIYQIQNKAAIPKEASEDMFWKAVMATALSFVISSFGPIDEWTHLGAGCAGIAYGFITCPTLQLDNASSRSDQEEGITLVRRNGDHCKSIIAFAIFIVVFSSLIVFLETQTDILEFESIL